jgi:hypothetical protein
MTTPAWWPAVLAATARRRVAAREMLDHATPAVVDGTLRLTFANPAVAAAWEESGAQTALEAALAAGRWEMPVEVISNR